MAELCVFPIKHSSFCSHFYFSYPFFVFMWVTARHLQHGKGHCKFEKDWYNVIQKVKTLPVKTLPCNFAAAVSTLAS